MMMPAWARARAVTIPQRRFQDMGRFPPRFRGGSGTSGDHNTARPAVSAPTGEATRFERAKPGKTGQAGALASAPGSWYDNYPLPLPRVLALTPPREPAMDQQLFDELQKTLETEGPARAIDRLCETLRQRKDY